MVAGSILPVSIKDKKLYFLFGKENPMEDSAKGWSDFGGGCENNENPRDTAIREGSEELTGFLGNPSQIKKLMEKNGEPYVISHNDYHVHLFLMNYDENLPTYYNNNHSFLWNKMDNKILNDSKLFEKIEINWFSVKDLALRRNEFRSFYREIVDIIKKQAPHIMKTITKPHSKTHNKSHRKTQKKSRKP